MHGEPRRSRPGPDSEGRKHQDDFIDHPIENSDFDSESDTALHVPKKLRVATAPSAVTAVDSDEVDSGHSGDELPSVVSVPLKRRGRPSKPKDTSDSKASIRSFFASVFVSIENAPQLKHGKTSRTDKLVPQKPRIEGPFSFTSSMTWMTFLHEISEAAGIGQENLRLEG